MKDVAIAESLSTFACLRARHALADAEASLNLARWSHANRWTRLAQDRLEFALLNLEFAEGLLQRAEAAMLEA